MNNILKKGCEKMSAKDNKLDQIIKTVEANDIKFLKLELSDIHGLPKSMAVPLKNANDVEDIVNEYLEILYESHRNHTYKEYDR